jgi:AcrR family transcriptional regulator
LEEDTESKILNYSEPYFIQNGYSRSSLDDIATNLGISKKTIYKYFSSKEEIQIRCTQNRIQRINERIQSIIDSSDDFYKKIEDVSACMTEKENILGPSYFTDLKKHCPKAWQLFEENQKSFIPLVLEKVINEGIRKKLINKDIDKELTITVYLMLMRSLIDLSSDNPLGQNYSPNELKKAFNQIFFLGIIKRDS